MNKFKIALCQTPVIEDKIKNINTAIKYVKEAKSKGAQLVTLPEIFNCPYDNKFFKKYSEQYPSGETLKALSNLAKEENIFLIGGSIPELSDEKVYNTSFIFDNHGNLIHKHRKAHLFDIDIKDKITFKESDTLTPGNNITVFDTPFCKVGVAICYDMRFPELFRAMTLMGAELIIIPAAFNMTTGPAHWDLTLRARALDNQLFVAAVSPARNENASYVAYGHSTVVSPWGNIINQLNEKKGILIQEIDLDEVKKIREQLPLLKHRKPELYK